MTADLLVALFRNLHAASEGTVHSASAIAIMDYLWNRYRERALQSGQQAYDAGADPEQAFRDSMAESLGMSRTEFDMYWDSDYTWGGEGFEDWKRNVSDPLDEYFRKYGAR